MVSPRTLVASILLLLLVACATPKPSAAPAVATPPTVATTNTPLATTPAGGEAARIATAVEATVVARAGTTFAVAPIKRATRTPVTGMPLILPAPLYFRATNQVLRLERDAANYRQITFEPSPVLELAVPTEDGAIFYLTGDPAGTTRTLVTLSGAGRRELLVGELSSFVVSPDGRQIFVRMDATNGPTAFPAGVWTTTPVGGQPKLLLADGPTDGVATADASLWTYRPIAVAPDGSRVALYAYATNGPSIPGGKVVLIGPNDAPVYSPTCCEDPVWSDDSTVLHTAGGGPGPDMRYGLAVTNAATGVEQLLKLRLEQQVPLVTAPQQLTDGHLYAFIELTDEAGFSWEHPFRPALARVNADGSVTPLAPPTAAPDEVLWRADGSGAVFTAPALQQDNFIFWQSTDGQPAVRLPFTGNDLAWVPTNSTLAAGACAAFNPLRYQSAGERQFSAAVFDLQGRLQALGFDAGPSDGFYGDQTRTAVQVFQQSWGLSVTGEVDCTTWQAMLAQP